MSVAIRPVHAALQAVMAEDRGRILAALIARLRDFQLAEDCLQDAIEAALGDWQRGVPDHPGARLLRVAQRKAIDRLRRDKRFAEKAAEIAVLTPDEAEDAPAPELPDHRLQLIFTCCHPALDAKTRVALTLRTIGGLSTEEIARAFLDKTPAMAARLTRAKAKIARAGIAYEVPAGEALTPRMASVLSVIYLTYNEGYAATSGKVQLRHDLCEEAIYLARLMAGFCPRDAEVLGLLALILLSHARRVARTGPGAEYVPLPAQDRQLWDDAMIAEGQMVLAGALAQGRAGPYQLQAAIAALHCEAASHQATDWPQIVALYRLLTQMDTGDVVRLNHAVALSYAGQLPDALCQLETLAASLSAYQPYHAARADLLARSGQWQQARDAYAEALRLTRIDSERRFLEGRVQKLGEKKGPGQARPSPTGR